MKTHSHRTTRALPGFTLFEVLIVVAIIIALAGVLMPQARRVIASAKSSTNAQNLRQLAAAAALHAADKGGLLPSPYGDTNGDGKTGDDGDLYPAQIFPYLSMKGKNDSTYLTPELLYGPGPFQSPLRDLEYGAPSWYRNGYSYGISSFLLHPSWNRRLANVADPASVILFADKVSTGERKDPNYDSSYLGAADGPYVRPWSPDNIGGNIWASGKPAYRHNGGRSAQVAFVDGHVATFTSAELELRPRSGRSLWQWWE
jgi:prepilin-type processing-associated H-X9-DG protein